MRPVRIVTCSNEREEAQFVLERISAMQSDHALSDFAVLFRTNAQSRPFEEELLRANMPYSVVGGVKFYERAEIKDVLSYQASKVFKFEEQEELHNNIIDKGLLKLCQANLKRAEVMAQQRARRWRSRWRRPAPAPRRTGYPRSGVCRR